MKCRLGQKSFYVTLARSLHYSTSFPMAHFSFFISACSLPPPSAPPPPHRRPHSPHPTSPPPLPPHSLPLPLDGRSGSELCGLRGGKDAAVHINNERPQPTPPPHRNPPTPPTLVATFRHTHSSARSHSRTPNRHGDGSSPALSPGGGGGRLRGGGMAGGGGWRGCREYSCALQPSARQADHALVHKPAMAGPFPPWISPN